jgi:hypothetical protein
VAGAVRRERVAGGRHPRPRRRHGVRARRDDCRAAAVRRVPQAVPRGGRCRVLHPPAYGRHPGARHLQQHHRTAQDALRRLPRAVAHADHGGARPAAAPGLPRQLGRALLRVQPAREAEGRVHRGAAVPRPGGGWPGHAAERGAVPHEPPRRRGGRRDDHSGEHRGLAGEHRARRRAGPTRGRHRGRRAQERPRCAAHQGGTHHPGAGAGGRGAAEVLRAAAGRRPVPTRREGRSVVVGRGAVGPGAHRGAATHLDVDRDSRGRAGDPESGRVRRGLRRDGNPRLPRREEHRRRGSDQRPHPLEGAGRGRRRGRGPRSRLRRRHHLGRAVDRRDVYDVLRGATSQTWDVGARPRSSHAKLAGETVGIDSAFSNGMSWPGDSGDADEVAGCNCTITINYGGTE